MTGGFFTLREFAERLKEKYPEKEVSKRTLKRYCKQGMRYFDDNGRWLICDEWYDDYVRAHTHNAPEVPDAQ